MGNFLCGLERVAFCERSFALHRQQPEKEKQNIDVVLPWKNFRGRP